MTPVKTFIVALVCGVALLSAGTAHAALTSNSLTTNGLALNGIAFNGLSINGIAFNGLALNGIAFNGLAINGLIASEGARVEGPRDRLLFNLISQRALGKTLQ